MMNILSTALLIFADTWDMHDWGGGWWVVMVLVMLLFWGLVIAGIVWAIRAASGPRPADGSKTAREVLDERLAAGDISVEEYEQRRDLLAGRRGSSAP
jgi:putative membrane protein